jgi:hypothetical protein
MISRQQFAIAYNKANVAATSRKAPPPVITEGYETLTESAKALNAPNAVAIFRTTISKKDGKLNWDIYPNDAAKLKPTRAYFDPRSDGSALLKL